MSFVAFIVVTFQVKVFWGVPPCSIVVGYHSVKTQKTSTWHMIGIFIWQFLSFIHLHECFMSSYHCASKMLKILTPKLMYSDENKRIQKNHIPLVKITLIHKMLVSYRLMLVNVTCTMCWLCCATVCILPYTEYSLCKLLNHTFYLHTFVCLIQVPFLKNII